MAFFDWLFGTKEINELRLEVESLNVDIEAYKRQISSLKQPSISPNQPKVYGTINMSEVMTLLKPHTTNLYLSDINTSITTVAEAKRFSNETKVQARKYIKNKYDCDEFSFSLAGYWNEGLRQFCFGMAWTKTHAFNIMIDNKKEVYLIEPQTNRFYKLKDKMKDKNFYPLNLIII